MSQDDYALGLGSLKTDPSACQECLSVCSVHTKELFTSQPDKQRTVRSPFQITFLLPWVELENNNSTFYGKGRN